MYLTQGQFKGRKIKVPDGVKPTLSKVRESVFNMLTQFSFEDYSFLDMFSGSGLMSLEAISREYEATSLEINKKNILTIKENFKNLGLKPNIILANALNFKTDKKFEIIYLDPPWEMDYLPIIKKAKSLLKENGVIIAEFDKERGFSMEEILKDEKIEIIKNKKYGRALISILK